MERARSDGRRSARIAAFAAAATLLCAAGSAGAGDGVAAFLEPQIGYTAVTLKALEIEASFLRPRVDEDGEPIVTDDWEDVDPAEYQATVGRRAYYEGGGFSCGAVAGVRLFAVQLGLSYTFDDVALEGYSKRYRFMPERLRAGGKRFKDDGQVAFHRIAAALRYTLPVWRIQVELQTRIGGIAMDEGPLIVGRAVREGWGFAGDLGVGLSFAPARFLTLRLLGFFGFFSFPGDYEGAYGTLGGFTFSAALSI